jgi:hypothetical protein
MPRTTARRENAPVVTFVGNSPALTDFVVLLGSQRVLHKRAGDPRMNRSSAR